MVWSEGWGGVRGVKGREERAKRKILIVFVFVFCSLFFVFCFFFLGEISYP